MRGRDAWGKGISFRLGRRGNQPASFPRWRTAADRSRTRVLVAAPFALLTRSPRKALRYRIRVRPAPTAWARHSSIGSFAQRHHRKAHGLFPRESPPESGRNPRHSRPADSGQRRCDFKAARNRVKANAERRSVRTEPLPVIPAGQPRPNPKEIPGIHVLRTANHRTASIIGGQGGQLRRMKN